MAEFCAFTDNIAMECGDDFPIAGMANIYLAPVRQIDLANTTFSTTEHDVTAIALKSSGKFVKIEGRVGTKDLTTENTKDGGGNLFTVTANAVIPNITKVKSFLLELFGKQKVVAIIELYTQTSGDRNAVIIGLDNKMKADAGAVLNFNDTVEAEAGGLNGYNLSIVAAQGESVRFMTGDILVEDGSTGTTVSLG